MKPGKLVKALLMPIFEPAVFFPLIMFWLLLSIGTSGSLMGLLVLILALRRFFVIK